jgi:dTDP-4-dehydrorhamnose 3,5-epimerase
VPLVRGRTKLTDEVVVIYLVSAYHTPSHYRGVRWNDPAFGIEWPMPPGRMHERDRTFPDFVA